MIHNSLIMPNFFDISQQVVYYYNGLICEWAKKKRAVIFCGPGNRADNIKIYWGRDA